MLPMDCHTHTSCSPDSTADWQAMCKKAESLGLQAFAITDHIELCRFWSQGFYDVPARNDEDFFDYSLRYERAMQQNQLAKDMLSGLSKEERQIVALVVFGGYKGEEIAKMLHRRHSTIRSKYRRALKKLEQQILTEEVQNEK